MSDKPPDDAGPDEPQPPHDVPTPPPPSGYPPQPAGYPPTRSPPPGAYFCVDYAGNHPGASLKKREPHPRVGMVTPPGTP